MIPLETTPAPLEFSAAAFPTREPEADKKHREILTGPALGIPKWPLGLTVSNGMTILVDLRPLVSGVVSGVETYTVSLLAHLLKTDTRNRYLFFLSRFRKKPLPPEWDFLTGAGALNWHIPNKALDAWWGVASWPPVDTFVNADVVFSPHLNLLRASPRARRVITIHDLSFVHYPHFFPLRKRFWHWTQHVRAQVRRAARVIAVSEFTKKDMMATWHLPEEKIAVVHSGINPFYLRLPENDAGLRAFREQHGLAQPFILFVGTLEPRKNIPGIIRAFNVLKGEAAFRGLSLILVGRRGWLYDGIARAISGSPHRNDIRLWGSATEEELRYLYNLAAAFTYPSFFEGFGFPVLEAQACGAPVIASNVTSLPEILGESAILVPPRDTDAIARAVAKVVANSELRAALREKGFANVKRFSWQRAAEETLAVLEETGNQP